MALISSLIFILAGHWAWADKPLYHPCSSADEYIKVYEYLLQQKDLELSPQAIAEQTFKISRNCDHSFERFVEVFSDIKKWKISSKVALELSASVLMGGERQAALRATLVHPLPESLLNGDQNLAIKVIQEISFNELGDIPNLRDSFDKMLAYCMTTAQIQNVSKCVADVIPLTRKADWFLGANFWQPFSRIEKFLGSQKNLSMTSQELWKRSLMIAQGGNNSVEQFIRIFTYAINPRTLSLTEDEAYRHALKIALQSFRLDKKEAK